MKILLFGALMGAGLLAIPARAGWLDDLATVVTAPITAPIEATIDVIRGDDPTHVITDPLAAGGRAINDAVGTAQQVQQFVYGLPREAIRSTLGDGWVRAYDTLTASQRVQYELMFTSGRFLGGCLQGAPCSLQQLTAMPVAAAMRDAYRIYAPYSVSLDPDLIRYLSPVVPAQVLYAARWTVARTPDLTVPGMLNAGYSALGGGHAVTLANVMIFSHRPDLSTCADLDWLIHELRHVEQYIQYSGDPLEAIDGFAVDYTYNYNWFEDDARAAAATRVGYLGQYYGFRCSY